MQTPISQKIDVAIQEMEIKMQDYAEQQPLIAEVPVAPYDYTATSSMDGDMYSLYYNKKPTIKHIGTISIAAE